MMSHFSQKLALACMFPGLLFGVPLLALTAQPPIAGQPVLVVVAPWDSLFGVVEKAGGRVIGPQLATLGGLAIAEQPEFFQNLKKQGAWAVLDGRRTALLCGV